MGSEVIVRIFGRSGPRHGFNRVDDKVQQHCRQRTRSPKAVTIVVGQIGARHHAMPLQMAALSNSNLLKGVR